MEQFSPFPGLQIAYSHRKDGSFRDHDSIKKFLQTTIDLPVSYLQLEHSDQIISIDEVKDQINVGDSIVTNLNNQILSFSVGDCFPVVLFDSTHNAFALIHCGWKSLSLDILEKTANFLNEKFQSKISNLHVWIGPGICKEHYIHNQAPEQLTIPDWQNFISEKETQYHVDLPEFITHSLQKEGIIDIVYSDICTYEQENNLFSHHRSLDTQENDGRLLVGAWISHN